MLFLTELTFLKHLARRFNINTPQYLEWPAARYDLKDFMDRANNKALAKADILTGSRGKGGAVVNINSTTEATKELTKLSTAYLKEKQARTAYLVEYIPQKCEVFTAITYDSLSCSPVITISLHGGVDIESLDSSKKRSFVVENIYNGIDAYQVGGWLGSLKCPKEMISKLAVAIVSLWDMFISCGFMSCEVNPWRITKENKVIACDFKATLDSNNFRQNNLGFDLPEYPEDVSDFEEEMNAWNNSSYQGQAHVSEIPQKATKKRKKDNFDEQNICNGVLPILFGGGASLIVTDTLIKCGGDPLFLSDFGGNPPYERMKKSMEICLRHHLKDAGVLLILGGKANNTRIDVTFKAISDAIHEYAYLRKGRTIPVIIGRGGPQLINGILTIKETLEELEWPYAIFGHDTPISMVAEYTASLYKFIKRNPKALRSLNKHFKGEF
ncbi:ATP-grasp domain-containing protein [Lentisphaerota bacterium WC36G]|nr:hypothetical protein LJT99_05850 [Lentisphaerae bacterium WC36]